MTSDYLLLIKLSDGCHQFIQGILDRGIRDLCAGCGCVAAAAQRLQDHLRIGAADASGRDDDPVIIRIQHKRCCDAGDIQQLISRLGRQHTGGGGIEGGNGDLLPVEAGGFDDVVLGNGILEVILQQLLDFCGICALTPQGSRSF